LAVEWLTRVPSADHLSPWSECLFIFLLLQSSNTDEVSHKELWLWVCDNTQNTPIFVDIILSPPASGAYCEYHMQCDKLQEHLWDETLGASIANEIFANGIFGNFQGFPWGHHYQWKQVKTFWGS
jgi:hypothetical protein